MGLLIQNRAFANMPKAVERVYFAIQPYLAPAEPAKPAKVLTQACQYYEKVIGTDAGAKFFIREAAWGQRRPLQGRHKKALRRLQCLIIQRIL